MNLDSFLDAAAAPATPPAEKKEILEAAEAELALFDQFIQAPVAEGGCGQDGLVPGEMALIRTYLVGRLSGRFPSTLEK